MKLVTKQVKFTDKEAQFLEQNEICRFATASKTGQLHIVPVSYVSHEGLVYIATDYGTRKLGNLRENPNGALLVDTNATRKAVMISGKAQLIEKGEEYRRIYKLFHSRLDWPGSGEHLGKRAKPPSSR